VRTISAEAISTGRLELLTLLVEHAEKMAAVLSDPALHTFTGGTPDTPQALRSRYQRLTAGSPDPAVSWLNWVIRLRDEARLTGTVQATIRPSGDGLVAEHLASVAVAAAAGLTPTDEWHEGEVLWRRTIHPGS
jgi:hypothetical protein